jgi:hypothetical protein
VLAQATGTGSKTSAVNKVSSEVHAQLRVDISTFVGTYFDPGYGSFTLCDTRDWPSSSHCGRVLTEFQMMNDTRADTLYASWPRVDASHFRLVRNPLANADKWGNNTFAFRPTSFFPSGYGKNTTGFEGDELNDYEDIKAGYGWMEFVVEEVNGSVDVKGLGWFGTVDFGVIPERQRSSRTVQERADVWFTKLGAL